MQRSPSAASSATTTNKLTRSLLMPDDQMLNSEIINNIADFAAADFKTGFQEDSAIKQFIRNVNTIHLFSRTELPIPGVSGVSPEQVDQYVAQIDRENPKLFVQHVNSIVLTFQADKQAYDNSIRTYNAIVNYFRTSQYFSILRAQIASRFNVSHDFIHRVIIPRVIVLQAKAYEKNLGKNLIAEYPRLQDFLDGKSACFHPSSGDFPLLFVDPKFTIRANTIPGTRIAVSGSPQQEADLPAFFDNIVKTGITRAGVFVDSFKGHCKDEKSHDSVNWFLHPVGHTVLKNEKFKITVGYISEGYEKLLAPLDEKQLKEDDRKAVRVELHIQLAAGKLRRLTVYFFKTEDGTAFECLGAKRKIDRKELMKLKKYSSKEGTLIFCKAGLGRSCTEILAILLAERLPTILKKLSVPPAEADLKLVASEILRIVQEIRQARGPSAIITPDQLKSAIRHAFFLHYNDRVSHLTQSLDVGAQSMDSSARREAATPASSPKTTKQVSPHVVPHQELKISRAIAALAEPKLPSAPKLDGVGAHPFSMAVITTAKTTQPKLSSRSLLTSAVDSRALEVDAAPLPSTSSQAVTKAENVKTKVAHVKASTLSSKTPEVLNGSAVAGATDKPKASQPLAASAPRLPVNHFTPAFVNGNFGGAGKPWEKVRYGLVIGELPSWSTNSKSVSQARMSTVETKDVSKALPVFGSSSSPATLAAEPAKASPAVAPSMSASEAGAVVPVSVAQAAAAATSTHSFKAPELLNGLVVAGAADKPKASPRYFAPAFIDDTSNFRGAVRKSGQVRYVAKAPLTPTSSNPVSKTEISTVEAKAISKTLPASEPSSGSPASQASDSKSVTRAVEPANASLVAARSVPVSEATVDAAMPGQAATVGAINRLPVSASKEKNSSVPKFLSREEHFTADKDLDEKDLPSLLPTSSGTHAASSVPVSASASRSSTASSMAVLGQPVAPQSVGPSSRARADTRLESPPPVPRGESAGFFSTMVTGLKKVHAGLKQAGDGLDKGVKNLQLQVGSLPFLN